MTRAFGDDHWSALAADLSSAAILTDFDGTLSEIVTDPEAAVPLSDAVSVLEELAEHAHTVAVISGRPLEFLTTHFGGHVVLAGLYGLEVCRDGVVTRPSEVERWRSVIAETAELAAADLPKDVLIEPKGLAITLHYRAVPERREAIETWAASRASVTGLVVAQARCSVELNPPLPVDKGTVVESLAGAVGVRRACYLGDDRADVAAFEALRRLERTGVIVETVAVRGAETPGVVTQAADRVVAGPHAALALLRSLLPVA